MTDKLSRRSLIGEGLALGALAVFGAAACSKSTPAPLSCADATGLPPGDAQVRSALGYIDVSNQPGKSCAGCVQFIPGAPGACGTCKVVKGPINPAGYCRSFTPKPA